MPGASELQATAMWAKNAPAEKGDIIAAASGRTVLAAWPPRRQHHVRSCPPESGRRAAADFECCAMRLAYRPAHKSGLMASTGSGVTDAELAGGGREKHHAARSASVTAAARPRTAGQVFTTASRSAAGPRRLRAKAVCVTGGRTGGAGHGTAKRSLTAGKCCARTRA